MVTAAQLDEYTDRGVLRLPGAIPAPRAAAMRDRVWAHLFDRYAIRADRPDTWPERAPAHFQKLTATGAFDAMASDELRTALDGLLGAGRWQPPEHWGRPLVTFPGDGWDVPARGWHVDAPDEPGAFVTAVVFAHLAPVRPRGGGTLVLAGSHRLPVPTGLRSADLKTYLGAVDPWLRDLWNPDAEGDRIQRYLAGGAVVGGVPLRVEELTGEPGDAVVMHPRLLHAVAPNGLPEPRLMLLQFLSRYPAQGGATA